MSAAWRLQNGLASSHLAMRKYLVLVSTFALFAGVIVTSPAATAAAPKLGSACTKVGSFFDQPNKRFVCTKEGAKKVWRMWYPANQGPKTTSNNSASNEAPKQQQAPFVSRIPITLPVPQDGTITFANAISKIADIPSAAYKRVQDVIAANSAVDIPTSIYIGPKTDTTKEQITTLLQKNYRLFQGFNQPSEYFGLVYNGKDEPWAEKELTSILKNLKMDNLYERYVSVMRGACDLSNKSDPQCTGGNAIMLYPTTGGISFYGVQEPYWNAANQRVGAMSQVNHEYTHTVQFAQFFGVPLKAGQNSGTDVAHTKMPCWFQEGQANGIGIPVWASNFSEYSDARKQNIARGVNPNLPKPSLTTYTAASFTKFLYDQDPLKCYNPSSGDYQLGYSVGYAATEALVAIGGPQATMALLTKMAGGDDWAAAFQNVYGISWKEGSTKLGEILAAEYAVLPLGSTG